MSDKGTDGTYCVLRAYALRLACGNENMARVLMTKTMLRIKENATAFPVATMGFDIWASVVMNNVFYQEFDDADRRELYILLHKGSTTPFNHQGCDGHTLREQLRVMSCLTPQQATAATLRLNGCSHRLIAEQMGVGIECVRYHILNARLAMTKALGN